MAPKLTETFNDKAKSGKQHITPAHEPIRDDLRGGLSQRSDGGAFLPLVSPFAPAPPVEISKPPETIQPSDPVPERRPPPQPVLQIGQPVFNLRQIAEPTSLVQSRIVELSEVKVPQEIPLKVALIGTAPSSRMLAPFNDKTWQIWGCSPGNQGILPRCDVWFEIHGNLLWPEHKHYGEPYLNWLKTLTIPIYMQDNSLVPNAKRFPKEELIKEFGQDFFTSSFAWMMAFAIYSGAKELSLYGIDMASRDEYILQRPGFYYFRQMARIRGCKVSAPNESDIMMPPGLYGYSDVKPFGRKILARETEIRQRIAAEEQEVNRRQQNIFYLKGALEDLDYFKSIWIGAQDNSLTE